MQQRYFSAIHSNTDVRKNSSSGGAFTAITDAWIKEYKEKAVVYGCAFTNELKLKHIRGTDVSARDLMRGSKYISSDLTSVYIQVAEDIRAGNYVVFSGTPCQIAALIKYLKTSNLFDTDRLLLIDFICHGVGSNRFFEEYISCLERKYKSKAVSCSFRGKRSPDKVSDMLIVFENGKKYSSHATKYDWFYSAYYGNYILRPSCYNCKYTSRERLSDICLGDHWGGITADYSATSSLVITSTDKGELWALKAFNDMDYESLDSNEIKQLHLQTPPEKPSDYDEFWRLFESEGYLAAQRLIGNNTLAGKLKATVACILDRTHLLRVLKKLKVLLKK